ncbi:MAG: protein translocase subunit SecD [Rhodospirillales bacterium]|jgi:preprotein translocase subunit SecD|nr:protein translocase subunit SecD [Rhodospirillales bacterium]MBT4041132.1 protein translocase subunit SecD [Rhodospirillales bacterium]MBT4626720.1 protein translocase subunit SecD [Rhodospirillales bacterium]MBT5350720.1 protein translocase subunit SecD [Rhodospirillales bacterium]MBT5519564.1 protein translocase subunit SecD [Rhodospirillales bacterium]
MIYFAKWKIFAILGICVLGLAFAAPNFLDQRTSDSLPDWLPHKQVSLGLDLQGGSHLLLEVQSDNVIQDDLEAIIDSVRTDLRKERIKYRNLGLSDEELPGVSVSITDPEKLDIAYELLRQIEPGTTTQSNDDGLITIELDEVTVRDRKISTIQQSIEIVRRRIDETGVREPTIQRQGDDRILVQLPGVDDPERIKALLGKTAKMAFHLVDQENSISEALAGRIPPGSRLMYEEGENGGEPRPYLIRKRIMVSGETLVDAQPSQDQRTGEPIVSFRFDTRGAKKFADVTSINVGKPFAIVLDGKVISAPVIRQAILGGSGQISGNFSFQTAQDLALLLRAGALPAPLIILEERTVGPGLGADSIAAGKIASIIGLIAVIVFMGAAYGLFGIMADVALIMNIFLILAVLSVLQATLTLPGIAGIVLTIGMAVDANVLVFERIREEFRIGRTAMSAVDAGYSRAFKTIIDANVTTLIAAVLLYSFGSGPVRGFAVTLAVGIVTSMFTAIMLVRLMAVSWLRAKKPSTLPI